MTLPKSTVAEVPNDQVKLFMSVSCGSVAGGKEMLKALWHTQ